MTATSMQGRVLPAARLAADSGRRRGRPLRLPEDLTPIGSVQGPAESRIAWLLATSRLYAAGGTLDRASMAGLLGERGVAADKTRLSRWESGQHAVPDGVVAGYESALGRAPGSLAVIARSLQPPRDPAGIPAPLDGEPAHATLDETLARIIDRRHTGTTWVDLADELSRYEFAYLDRGTWRRTAGALASELGRSVRLAHVRRHEALRCLVRHRSSSRHAVRELVATVTDPDAQSEAHALTVLTDLDHPRVNRLVMTLLHSERANLAASAFRVCAAKLARGQLDAHADRIAAAVARALSSRAGVGGSVDAVDALVQLPAQQQERVMVSVPLRERRRIATAVAGSELVAADVARRIAADLATEVQRIQPCSSPVEPDLMLERLLREALFHTHEERRHQASLLLGASPYAPSVADLVLDLASAEDDWVASRALLLLLYVGAPQRMDTLWSLLDGVGTEVRPVVGVHAMLAVAHLDVALPAEVESRVAALSREHAESRLGEAAVRLLGMHGSWHLDTLAVGPRTPVVRAAQWWLTQGPAIHEPL